MRSARKCRSFQCFLCSVWQLSRIYLRIDDAGHPTNASTIQRVAFTMGKLISILFSSGRWRYANWNIINCNDLVMTRELTTHMRFVMTMKAENKKNKRSDFVTPTHPNLFHGTLLPTKTNINFELRRRGTEAKIKTNQKKYCEHFIESTELLLGLAHVICFGHLRQYLPHDYHSDSYYIDKSDGRQTKKRINCPHA